MFISEVVPIEIYSDAGGAYMSHMAADMRRAQQPRVPLLCKKKKKKNTRRTKRSRHTENKDVADATW